MCFGWKRLISEMDYQQFFFRHEQNIMFFYFELWHHIFDKVSKFKLLFAFSFDSLENYPFVQVLAYNFNNLRRRIPVSLPS